MGSLSPRANPGIVAENPTGGPEATLPSRPPPPETQADIEHRAREIPEAIDAEIGELAATLVTTDEAHPFGANELTIRALAHTSAARAVERHRARNKTAPQAPA